MAKRVGLLLAGSGHRDGTDIREATFLMLALERGGAEVVCAAPDRPNGPVVDHVSGQTSGEHRSVLGESARLARGKIVTLADLDPRDLDALVVPGGWGVALVLSNYAEKGALCDVDPDVVRVLKAMLSARKPMGFVSVSAVLAARVLGPVAGVRLTLGSNAFAATKHAAVMGAEIRHAEVGNIVIDQKHRVVSTPGYLYDDASYRDVAVGLEKLVRTVLSFARDRQAPSRPAPASERAVKPAPAPTPPTGVIVRPARDRPTP